MRFKGLVRHAIILGPILWLSACAGQPEIAAVQPVESPTIFAFSQGSADASDATPLGPNTWLRRQARASVPVLDEGTPIEIVIMTLLQWGLEPQIVGSSVIVREGPSRNNFLASPREAVIYSFDDGLLLVGPLTEAEMVDVFLAYNLTRVDYELLLRLDEVQPLSAMALNNMAWALATWHDESRRAPSVALDLAIRANERSRWSDAYYLDTLAAAYAANGRFRDAAIHQQWAIMAADPKEAGMTERLELYKSGEVYVEAQGGGATLDPTIQEQYEAALQGDATAQWEFALYCMQEDIGKFGGLENPGRHFLTLAAQQGEPFAVEEYGYALLYGEHGIEADPAAARAWFDRAVAYGSALAAYNLSAMYQRGLGVERDEQRATHWLRVAADRGIPEAAVEVAYRYLEGVGAPPSPELADELFARAAAEDIGPLDALYGLRDFDFDNVVDEAAQEQLAELTVPPRAFPRYLVTLVDNMQRELEQDQPYVTARLPDVYVAWRREDAPEVILLFTRAAASYGSRDAQERLAFLYERGDGVASSAELAAYWRDRAAGNQGGL